MEIMRLVVTGPVGSGKSTFIRSVSEIAAIDTDRRATDETALLKKRTTVAFDFGRLAFGPEMALYLYGTPGQSRFAFMWDILIRKAHAYILLVAAPRPREFIEARRLRVFMRQRSPLKVKSRKSANLFYKTSLAFSKGRGNNYASFNGDETTANPAGIRRVSGQPDRAHSRQLA